MANLLLADDVAMAREGLARALRERGHKVSVATDGQEAVDRFLRERPDLVIVDVMMPRLSGLEACARMKAAAGAFVPVIVMSARGDLETRLGALAVAEDFVAKPYDAQEMCARVEAHLRTRRLVEEAQASASAPPPSDVGSAPAPGASAGSERAGGRAKGGPVAPRLLDRDAFTERVTEEHKRSARTTEPLALLVAGLDGESASEGVAPLLAAMQRSFRSHDAIAKLDDTHAAGLLLATHLTGAMAVAERLRRAANPLAVSMGFAFFPNRDVAEARDLLSLAERAIARAREAGVGRICLWQHQGYLFDPPE